MLGVKSCLASPLHSRANNVCGPLMDEDPGSFSPNSSWWASQVVAALAEDVPKGGEASECERYYKFVGENNEERWIRLTRLQLSGPPPLGSYLNRVITAFTEVRQPYWMSQPSSWITYHAITILELDGGSSFMVCERKTDMLELVFGEVNIQFPLMKAFRAMGPGRNPSRCVEEPRQALSTRITVRQLLGWIDGPVEENWKPYHLIKANCQHFAAELQAFLRDPSTSYHRSGAAVQVPVQMYSDREAVLANIARNPRALKYLPDKFRADKDVALTAVSVDGNTIRYVADVLQTDKQLVLAALRQNGYALPYISSSIRQDRDVVLEAVRQNGYVLCYCAEEHRSDRETVMAAVRQEAYAIRYVSGKLRYDPAVLLAASWQNPIAVARSTLLF